MKLLFIYMMIKLWKLEFLILHVIILRLLHSKYRKKSWVTEQHSNLQMCVIAQVNTVVSNHFHSVKIWLFSSARSRDFDGLIGTELPVSMYTTETPIDMCRFNVRSSTLKNLNIFCKRQISIKLFYLYQRFQCRDKYFFKIKFVFFLYLRLSASSKENDLPLCIYFWYLTDSEVPNTSIYSAVSLASPYYNYL